MELVAVFICLPVLRGAHFYEFAIKIVTFVNYFFVYRLFRNRIDTFNVYVDECYVFRRLVDHWVSVNGLFPGLGKHLIKFNLLGLRENVFIT